MAVLAALALGIVYWRSDSLLARHIRLERASGHGLGIDGHLLISMPATDFTGGHVPGSPPSFPNAPDITSDPIRGIGKWSRADFRTALRQGRRQRLIRYREASRCGVVKDHAASDNRCCALNPCQ